MAESIAARKARLAKEMEDLNSAENAAMDKALVRANDRIVKAIDQAAVDIAKAAKEIDGDDTPITEEQLKTALYAQYNVESESSSEESGSSSSTESEEGVVETPPEETVSGPGESGGGSPPPTEEEEVSTEGVEDDKPPATHWSEKPIFGRR